MAASAVAVGTTIVYIESVPRSRLVADPAAVLDVASPVTAEAKGEPVFHRREPCLAPERGVKLHTVTVKGPELVGAEVALRSSVEPAYAGSHADGDPVPVPMVRGPRVGAMDELYDDVLAGAAPEQDDQAGGGHAIGVYSDATSSTSGRAPPSAVGHEKRQNR